MKDLYATIAISSLITHLKVLIQLLQDMYHIYVQRDGLAEYGENAEPNLQCSINTIAIGESGMSYRPLSSPSYNLSRVSQDRSSIV